MGYLTLVAIMFLTGVLALVSPIFVVPVLPAEYRRRLAVRYFSLAQAAAQRVLLVRRKMGGYSLLPSEYDGEKKAEKVKLDGEAEHFDDPHRFMSRMHARPFGLAYERSSAIFSPLIAEIGREFHEWLENDGHKVALTDEEGNVLTDGDDRSRFAFNRTLSLPELPTLVDPAHVISVLPGSAPPSAAETAYEYAKKSQEGFNTRRMVEGMAIVVGFVAGFGIVFLAFKQGGGGGGVNPVNINMMLDLTGVLW